MKKKKFGHYCHVCGRRRPNEKFSGHGHGIHVCRECASQLRKEAKQAQLSPAPKPTAKWTKNYRKFIKRTWIYIFDAELPWYLDDDVSGIWFFDHEEDDLWFFCQDIDETQSHDENAYEIRFFEEGAFVIPPFDESGFNWASFEALETGLLPFIEVEPRPKSRGIFKVAAFGFDDDDFETGEFSHDQMEPSLAVSCDFWGDWLGCVRCGLVGKCSWFHGSDEPKSPGFKPKPLKKKKAKKKKQPKKVSK
ncbi:MAG: hypothetical protein LBF38_11650 [Deltaproteobacteria bacterium]|nr:hypothetical protein [Deltaproteobacteria bacterium]